MNIRTFDLERIQSLYENTVPVNLTESGFHPYSLKELLTPSQLEEVVNLTLGYGQTNGSIGVRRAIAGLYPGYDEDNAMVTNGSSEANFVACHTLLEKGDEVVIMVPNYMQIWGIVEEMGCTPKAFHLREENGWRPDLDELASLVTEKTKLIVITNPNNPTGYVLTPEEMKAIVNIAAKQGCWIFSDEVYRGADLDGVEKASFIGMYDKALVNGGLSKAYALPGLRLGWLAGPKEVIYDTWSYHDYTSITASPLSHRVAEIVLQPDMRRKVLSRSIAMLNENLAATIEWAKGYKEMLEFVPPQAGGMVFMRYKFPINSTELSDWMRLEKGVFIVAGDVYGLDHHFRLGIGVHLHDLLKGYDLLTAGLKEKFGV
jgi:aspartate/methionine/tyrosine aminotransferase